MTDFLRFVLKLRDAGLTDVIDELCQLKPIGENIPLAKELLRALNDCLREHAWPAGTYLCQIKERRVFPVRVFEGNSERVQLMDCSHSDWFIADQHRLRRCFIAKLPLLDFSVDDLKMLEPLIESLDLKCRKLSARVKEKTTPKGRLWLHKHLTASLRSKSHYLRG